MPGDAQLISALMQTAGHEKLPRPVTLKLANRRDVTSSVGFIHRRQFSVHSRAPDTPSVAILLPSHHTGVSLLWFLAKSEEMYFPK